jgi:DNA-damage-inducible protein J
MSKTATLTVRIDPKVKREAFKVFEKLGITASQAVTMYFAQVGAEKGLPFRPHMPNAETLQAMDDLERRRDVKVFETAEEVFADLGI